MSSGEFHVGEGADVPVRAGRRRKRGPLAGFAPAALAFPAWVVSAGGPGAHLNLANPLAAFELDLGPWRHLVPGRAYWFSAEAPLECLLARDGSPWRRDGSLRVGYQMLWNPGVTGYHAAGAESAVPARHRFELHSYALPRGDGGPGVLRASPCCDGDVRAFARAHAAVSLRLWDRSGGAGGGTFPWGVLSAVVAGRRAV